MGWLSEEQVQKYRNKGHIIGKNCKIDRTAYFGQGKTR